ncbi:arginine--tRNA ligase [Ferroacidibacillus organovorans]|uniref:arginine--tRNA ligase n=1 Tax=Ferroacidibacillus organovorans TaxID=1765683 RepID=UPI0009EE15F3
MVLQRYKLQIASHFVAQTGWTAEELANLMEVPPDRTLGDLALPCFKLAKTMRLAPPVIAQALAQDLQTCTIVHHAEATGGYLNVRLTRETVTTDTLVHLRSNETVFQDARGAGQTVAIDLSSPNIAKPFSMGHLRSTVIGTALANLFETSGYKTVRINHLGDWGTQFGKIIVAYRTYGDEATVSANPITELNRLYVQFHEEANERPELDDAARAAFKRLEDGNEEDLTLWRYMIDVSMKEFEKTYRLLGTKFDYNLGESFYNDKMDAVVDELREKGLLEESDGAEVVQLGETMPPCLIRRSDGATLYPTRDLAAALYRARHFHADHLLYVVGGEQRLHFQQVFAVLRKMGYTFADACEHIAFGLMRMGGKKMSTRKGQIVRLQEVLDEAITRARAIIEEKNPHLQNADAVARAVGVGAVIFNDLKTYRLHDIDFTMDTALAFDGETGPYVQYAHARTCSILRKAGVLQAGPSVEGWVTSLPNTHAEDAVDDATWYLTLTLQGIEAIRVRAIEERDPSLVAKHALDIAQAFNRFYHDCPILTSDGELKAMRLALTDAVRVALLHAMTWLGIEAPSEI